LVRGTLGGVFINSSSALLKLPHENGKETQSGFIFEHEPRCKVCTSVNRGLYHKMYESDRFTIHDIYQKSIELGESISKSSMYRHFNKHFVTKEKQPTTYDYSEDNSPILDERDVFHIILEFFKNRASQKDIQKFRQDSIKFFEKFNESQYPLYTSTIFQGILRELLLYADLQYLLDDFQEAYSKAVNRALTSEYYQKTRK